MEPTDKRGSKRASPDDIRNSAGRLRKASDPKKPVQHLPNWIQALFPEEQKL